MLPIVDKPAIQFIVEEAVRSGIEDIIIVTGRNKRAIEDHFDRNLELENVLREKGEEQMLAELEQIADLADIHYIRQKEARGLGHAVYCARKFIGNEPFAVLLGDDIISHPVPCLKQMMLLYAEFERPMVAVEEVKPEDVKRYGIIEPVPVSERVYLIKDVVEKPDIGQAPSRLGIVGRYILPPEIFEILERTPPGVGGEIQLTDAIKVLAAAEEVYAYLFKGERFDVGDKLGFLQATVDFGLRNPELGPDFYDFLIKKLAGMAEEKEKTERRN